jgi:hypothetical protein
LILVKICPAMVAILILVKLCPAMVANPGDIVSTTVTILDDEVSGSLVLPAPPMVNI